MKTFKKSKCHIIGTCAIHENFLLWSLLTELYPLQINSSEPWNNTKYFNYKRLNFSEVKIKLGLRCFSKKKNDKLPYNLTIFQEHEKAWKIIFGMTSSFYIIEAIMYLFYGTAKEQRWNKPEHYDRPRLSLAEIFETADTHSIYHLPRRLQKEMTTQARQH